MSYKIFDCLSEKTLIKGQKLLEASAGTGKTFAIEHIAVRLILSDVLIEEILIVTFTNLATEELKERILANLKLCCAILKGKKKTAIFPYLKQYFESEDILLKAVADLQNAILCFDDANIYTIHSFCKKALQEHSFEAELTFSLSDSKFEKEKQLLQNKLKKIFLNPKLKDIFFSSSFHYFLKNKKIESLLDKLISYANGRFEVEPSNCISIDVVLQKVKEVLEERGFVNLDQKLLLQDFHTHAKNYKKTKFLKEDFEAQVKLLAKITIDFFNLKAWDALLFHKVSIAKFFSKENLKLKLQVIEHENYTSFFQILSELIYPKLMVFFDPERFLNTLIYHFREDLIFQINKTDSLSADRLLEMMEEALNNLAFQRAIQQKYKAAIIDEFQDTDQVQWSIFLKAFLSKPKIPFFYLVGDPKQAIYAFRNADVYTYLKAANYLGEENTYLLDTNYRSTKSLVEGLNALFNRKWLYLPKLNNVLEYHPVKASNQSDTLAPIHYMVAERKNCSDIENEMFFPFILDEIIKKDRPYSQYAVLVKDRFQEQKLQNFLFLNDIPCNARKKPIHETYTYYCLKQIMRAVFEPNNLSNLKLIMLSLNYNLKDLEDEKKVSCLLVIFNQLHVLFKNSGIESCLSKLLDLSFHEWTLQERLMQKDSFSNIDLTDTVDLLLEYGQKNHISENSIDNFYHTVEKNSLQRQTLGSDDAVQILTIHKSKGLEFEVVFCLGVAFTSSSHVLQLQSAKEAEAEKLRQLYVAFTRAKSTLYIPVIISQKAKKEVTAIELLIQNILNTDALVDTLSLKNLLQNIHTSSQYEVTVLQSKKQPIICKKEVVLEKFLNDYPKHKSNSQFLSFTAVSNPFIGEKKQESCESFPVGALSGVIIHKILEDLFSKKSKKIELKKYLKDTPLAEFENQIEKMINKLLTIELTPFSFSLSDIDYKLLTTELEFCYRLDQNKMKGFIDLMFFHQGKYFIIDWKTNFLGNDDACYDSKHLHQAMLEHDYFLQGSIYVNALQKLLTLFDEKPFTEKFGGVFFIFLRGINAKGNGLFHYTPSKDQVKRAKF